MFHYFIFPLFFLLFFTSWDTFFYLNTLISLSLKIVVCGFRPWEIQRINGLCWKSVVPPVANEYGSQNHIFLYMCTNTERTMDESRGS